MSSTVIIVLQESTCLQLRQYLQMGEGPLLQRLFDDYLLQRLDSKQRASSKWKPKGGAANGPAGDVPVSLLNPLLSYSCNSACWLSVCSHCRANHRDGAFCMLLQSEVM